VAAAATGWGATAVLTAESPALQEPLADRYAHVIARVAKERGASLVVAAVSTFSKDILPRAAALLDAGMVSDVMGVRREGADIIYRRTLAAGNLIATVKLGGSVGVVTVRGSAFPTPVAPQVSPIIALSVDEASLPSTMTWVGREERPAGRPDATEARVVVSGGRALKDAADFERLIGGLADAMGGAVGSSRALVDAGITSNSYQIGQTGKIVAPELYVAVGISGAIQHTAGMRDAKVVVAINKDPEAPIFEVADYGLVADVYEAVPALITRWRSKPS
jgi:electron transfer flavoprotein alpha subunit